MNERQAIDLASQHGIPVSTDRRTSTGVSFAVGPLTIYRSLDSRDWYIGTGLVAYRRGDAMEVAVNRIAAAKAADLVEHMGIAEISSDTSGLPQTVFRTPDTGGWTNTNALASILNQRNCEVFITVLPRRYFL